MTTKRKPKSAIAAAVEELQNEKVEHNLHDPFDPPFAVKRVVIELLETWLPRHTVHASYDDVAAYLNALKETAHAG